ncbi:Uncharacterized protein APZ42_031606 [Daphnia magna]|uniref:Uncharacterized protein n=1 Tax=Daphnia magna TaxID=35525 RepID=A0A164MQ68_9CRUS|nr:Uncharacterized protein APZ42_031606 [Daphnia magna]
MAALFFRHCVSLKTKPGSSFRYPIACVVTCQDGQSRTCSARRQYPFTFD